MMYGGGKSDPGIVAVKLANNAEQSAAESVEPRTGTKGNGEQQSTSGAQYRESFSQALGRIRQISPSIPRGRSRTHKGARPDLCGGRGATRVPTATKQNIDETFKQTGWRFRQGNFCHCVIGAADDVGRMRIRAEPGHVLHANSTLVDRVDLATPLALSSQPLPAPRLLLLRSGLERSDFVPWPLANNPAGF